MAYIKKEPIIEFITKGLNNPDKTKAFGYDAIEILAEIEYAPTADVVEVVRCKDCTHLCKDLSGRNNHWCVRGARSICDVWNVELDDFCSYGKRRDI